MSSTIKDEKQTAQLILEPSSSKGELEFIREPQWPENTESHASRSLMRFVGCVTLLVPLVVGGVYNLIIASDRFVSTSSFMIRENQPTNSLLSMVGGVNISRSDDNSYAVIDYIRSRDAVLDINSDGFLSRVFSVDDLDIFSKFPSFLSANSQEKFYEHFQSYVDTKFDPSSGISTISVQSFTPENAHLINEKLLQAAEKLLNNLNNRAKNDSIKFAEQSVAEATLDLQKLQTELTAYRNDKGLLDPKAEAVVANKVMTSIMEQLAKVESELTLLVATAPDNPAARQLRAKRQALETQLSDQRMSVAGRDGSIAARTEGYEAIVLRRNLAESALKNALASLASARKDFENRRLYLVRIAQPSTPDQAKYPARLLNLVVIGAVGFALYWIIRSINRLLLEEV